MNETTLSINFGENNPVQLHIEIPSPTSSHWHNYLEIYYVLDGVFSIATNSHKFSLQPDQLLIINPFELHTISDSNARVAIFTINLSKFDQNLISSDLYFECYSKTSPNAEGILRLKRVLARFVKVNVSGSQGKELLNKSLSYSLMHILTSEFLVEDISRHLQNAQLARMQDILEYTNLHYAEHITLSDLAAKYYLTIPYMSKFFKTMMGTTFTEYMNDLRLSHVLNDLSKTDNSTDRLAELHGFANARSLVSAFRSKYHKTPSQYKRYLKANKTTPLYNTDFSDVVHTNYLGILSQYLSDSETEDISTSKARITTESAPIHTKGKKTPFSHTYQECCALGRAKEILFSENQKILEKVQKEIGFRYLCFHGLLDDDMMMYSEDAQGNIDLSFSMLDTAFDFLKSIHLKPVLELSFMPRMLAEENQLRTAFYAQSVVALPKDMDKWNYLIKNLINHLLDRYGDSEVETWPIYLWNTPDLPSSHLGKEGLTDYCHFYLETYKTVKACNPKLQFGSPNLSNHSYESNTTIEEFIVFAKTHNCMPDFMGMNYFPMEVHENFSNIHQSKTNLLMKTSPTAFFESLERIHGVLKKLQISDLPLHIWEWNSTISHRELLNDTAFKSAYVVKNILENWNNFTSLTYWTLSDLLEEVKLSGQQFHGGLGMFTFNRIPKAVYYAYELLGQLGDTLIAKGEGYFITKSASEWQIMLYNYHHYSELYAAGELFDMTTTSRYTAFPQDHIQQFTIPLSNMEDGEYSIFESCINKHHGSSFDKWVELGAETLVDTREHQYLHTASIPRMHRQQVFSENGQIVIHCELEPHEVRLLKIRKHYS